MDRVVKVPSLFIVTHHFKVNFLNDAEINLSQQLNIQDILADNAFIRAWWEKINRERLCCHFSYHTPHKAEE